MDAARLLLLVAAAAAVAGVAGQPFVSDAPLPTAATFPRLVVQPPSSQPGVPQYRNRVTTSPLRLPKGQPLCVVQRVEARAAAEAAAPTLVELGEEPPVDVSTPRGVLEHACKYAGAEDVEEKDGAVFADLARPENIEFKRVAQHFFSDIDPRADYALLGTPGGDMGELINAVAVAEELSGTRFRVEQLSAMLQDYWHLMLSRGRRYFYMGTDEAAMAALAKASGAADATRPRSHAERNAVMRHATEPDCVGSRHLRGMIERPEEYGVRQEVARWAVETFWSVYHDARNPLREHLLLVVLKGELKPAAAAARVWSPDACPGVAPLLVPKTPSSEAVVTHEAHVKFFRLDLARFMSFRNAELDVRTLYDRMNALAVRQEAHHSHYYTGAKTDVIFSSYYDRYPF